MANLKVRDLMTESPFTLGVDDNLTAIYDLMEGKHIRHLPVVDMDGDLVGLVTHRDLVTGTLQMGDQLPMANQRQYLSTVSVSEIMTPDVETTAPSCDLVEAAQLMMDNKFGCLPVVEGQRLLGIITEADFVRYLVENE